MPLEIARLNGKLGSMGQARIDSSAAQTFERRRESLSRNAAANDHQHEQRHHRLELSSLSKAEVIICVTRIL